MEKLILECNSCGYTWYPDKERWEKYPDAAEPGCPNSDCKNFEHKTPPDSSIWLKKGTVDPKLGPQPAPDDPRIFNRPGNT